MTLMNRLVMMEQFAFLVPNQRWHPWISTCFRDL